jgi:hypothetical protein
VPQTNPQAFDYEMPPTLISKITRGKTWAKYCEPCGREIAIDVIAVLERHDIYDRVNDERWRCKDCGGCLTGHTAFVISSLRHIGRGPAEKTMVMPARVNVPTF